MAEKLIPGIPEETRIVILQQTNASDVNTAEVPRDCQPSGPETTGTTALEMVIERATSKQAVQREIDGS